MLFVVLFLFLGIDNLNARSLQKRQLFGSCPSPTAVSSFDIDSFLGRWYEIERFANYFQWGDCVTADYSDNGDDTYEMLNSNVFLGFLLSNTAKAVLGSDPTVGELIISYSPFSGEPEGDPNYFILETDYSTYAVVFNCEVNFGIWATQRAWILSRTESLPDGFDLEGLKSRLADQGLNIDDFQVTNQENCQRP